MKKKQKKKQTNQQTNKQKMYEKERTGESETTLPPNHFTSATTLSEITI